MHSLVSRTAATVLLSAALLSAQDTATVTLGGDTDLGCQTQPGQIPTLTGGVRATASIDYAYDRSTGVLTMVVTNTSPDVPGEENPVITQVAINLPDGAITGATLLSQSAPSAPQPTWIANYASDGNLMGCFGDFDLLLHNGSGAPQGGISNANASNPGGPPNSQVFGPVTFVLQLSGPATENLNAHSIAYGFSSNGAQYNVNAAMKFVAGGVSGDESGIIATGRDCTCGTWAKQAARIGTTVELCQDGRAGCHDCIWVSELPGPTSFGAPFNFDVQVGLPLLAVIDFDFPATNEVCMQIPIPNDPSLDGFVLYFAVITHDNPLSSLDQIGTCGPFSLTVTM